MELHRCVVQLSFAASTDFMPLNAGYIRLSGMAELTAERPKRIPSITS